jgi:hypothetical protein
MAHAPFFRRLKHFRRHSNGSGISRPSFSTRAFNMTFYLVVVAVAILAWLYIVIRFLRQK